MCEVGLDEDGLEAGELLEAAVQEYHVHDVVTDVPLTLDLKRLLISEDPGTKKTSKEH